MGKQKGYLERQKRFGLVSKTAAWFGLVAAAVLAVAIVSAVYGMVGAVPLFGAVCLLLLLGLGWVFLQVWPAIRTSKVFAKRYGSGIAGEQAVWKELYNLPRGFRAYHDLMLGKGMTNIDFVVTGPCGIVTVEAKNHYGRVTTDGQNIFINGKPPAQNMLGQAGYEARMLSEFLEAKATGRVYVTAVLVFTNPKTFVDVETKVRGVHVLHLRQLVSFLSRREQGMDGATLQRIDNVLRLFLQSK